MIDSGHSQMPVQFKPFPDIAQLREGRLVEFSGLLVGVPGSGRTTSLLRISYDLAIKLDGPGRNLAHYLSAPQFLLAARSGQTVPQFIAQKVYPQKPKNARDVEGLSQWLAERNDSGAFMLLLDDLDRLAETEQDEVLSALTDSKAVLCAALPWQAERIAEQLPCVDLHSGFTLMEDLSREQQHRILRTMAEHRSRHHHQEIDLDLALSVLDQVPWLAKLPIGMAAIISQIPLHGSNPAKIVEAAVVEFLERAGHAGQDLNRQWNALSPIVRALLLAATIVGNNINNALIAASQQTVPELLAVSREAFDQSLADGGDIHWDMLSPTRLFAPFRGGATLCFINQDVATYLVARAITLRRVEMAEYPVGAHGPAARLLLDIMEYENALCEADPSRGGGTNARQDSETSGTRRSLLPGR
jgi:hypothetical protein